MDALKAKEKRKNSLPSRFPPPLQEPKLRSFTPKNSGRRKTTGIEAAIAAEADTAWARCKAEKELEIKQNYEAELAALCKDSSTLPLPQSRLPTSDSLLPALSDSQVRITNIDSLIHISPSDSESSNNVSVQSFAAGPSVRSHKKANTQIRVPGKTGCWAGCARIKA